MNGRSPNARTQRAWVLSGVPQGEAETRPRGEDPAVVGVQVEALEWVIGEQEAAVEVDPLGERCYGRRPCDADRRLLHAAEERAEAELARAGQHRLGRRDPAAFGELHVDAVDDADQG